MFTARVPGIYDSWCGRVEVRVSVQKKEEAARKAAAAGTRTSSSLDLLLDGAGAGAGAGAAGEKAGVVFGPLALEVRELSFVLDV